MVMFVCSLIPRFTCVYTAKYDDDDDESVLDDIPAVPGKFPKSGTSQLWLAVDVRTRI